MRAARLVAFAALTLAGCDRGPQAPPATPGGVPRMALESAAFANDDPIPDEFTPRGENVSPPLRWSAPPANTVELALVCEDFDAPGDVPFVHWLVTAIPRARDAIARGEHLGVEGTNDFGKIGWGGPAPPQGDDAHHYRFRIYALDRPLGLERGARRAALQDAMKGHVIAFGELVGTYRAAPD